MSARKLMILESSSKIAGVQQNTQYLAAKVNRALWEPVIACPEEGDLPRKCREAGLEVRILPRPLLLSTSFWAGNSVKLPNPFAWVWNIVAILIAASATRRFLAGERPAIVVTKGLLCHFYGGLAARRLGIPCIWYLEDFISERFGGIYRTVFGMLAKRLPSHIVVIGFPIFDQLPALEQQQTTIVNNAVDTGVFRPGRKGDTVRREFGIPADGVLIGNVSRLTPWKGQYQILEAFSSLAASNSAVYLLFAGAALFGEEAYETRLRARVRELGLDGRVIFTGHRDDVADLLAAMDIFAYGAVEKDVWPLSLLQAMSSGLPVVAFDLPGVREPLGTGEPAAWLVPVSGVARFAELLGKLAGDAGLRKELGRATRDRAQQACSLDRNVARLETLFDTCIGAAA